MSDALAIRAATVPAELVPRVWQVSPEPVPYEAAMAAMEAAVGDIRAGAAERVWLLEHPALYTGGTGAKAEDLRDPELPTLRTGRGGMWTYHGPGQRVAYVMLDLSRPHGLIPAADLRRYVWGLEEWLIRTLDEFGVRGERREGRVGVWVCDGRSERKIAAIGVRISRWVTWHGIALNRAPNLAHYAGIVPCGIAEHGVTSLAAEGVAIDQQTLDSALRRRFDDVFGEAAGC